MLGLALLGLAQSGDGEPASISSFAPALLEPGEKAFGDDEKLIVLPTGAEALTIPLPFRTGYIAPSPDGRALYVVRFIDSPQSRSKAGLYKIEFGPTRATPVAGSGGLFSISSIGSSENKVVVSAGSLDSAGHLDEKSCGIYELTLVTGKVRKILSNSDCKYKSSWTSISVSPDGEQFVAVHETRLMLMNLETGAVRSLGDGFYKAAWSPDGSWIAALEYGGRSRTILLDTSTFSKRRELPKSGMVWSPDSRHIVVVGQQSRCGEDSGTLELIDIENGKVSPVKGTACKVTSAIIGWLNVAGQ